METNHMIRPTMRFKGWGFAAGDINPTSSRGVGGGDWILSSVMWPMIQSIMLRSWSFLVGKYMFPEDDVPRFHRERAGQLCVRDLPRPHPRHLFV